MPLSWLEIDLSALRHNFNEVKRRIGPHTQILGVVKSDAYGHGMIPVARELERAGAGFLGVSKFWEARELRDHGIQLPVLVLLGVEAGDVEEALRLGIRPAVFRLDHARFISEAARRHNLRAPIHVKVDTGMGRLGVPFGEAGAFFDALAGLPGLELEGVFSHFASADESDKAQSELQWSRFQGVLDMLAARGRPVRIAHMANSAGILDLPQAAVQMVRPGIMLYGSQPSGELYFPADLRPVMALKAKILQIKEVAPNESIGYGGTFVTRRLTRVATIPVGYDDGYPRLLSNRGQVLIGGRRAPLVGRVSMNLITVDVTDLPPVGEDDEVVLLGSQGDERISADEIAALCGTISYEIYCGMGGHHFKFFLNRS